MRAPFLRLALLALLAPMATACTSVAAFNPFDDDPNGPPPAPHLFAENGDYGPDIVDSRSNRGEYQTAAVTEDRSPIIRHRTADSRSEYDRSYGTKDIEAAPLPPPEYSGAEPARQPEEVAGAEPVDRGERTLNTGRKRPATAEPEDQPAARTLMHKVKAGEELADIADTYHVREVDIIKANGMRPPYKLAKGDELKIPVVGTAGPAPGERVVAGDPVPAPKPDLERPAKAEPEPAEKPTQTAREEGAPRFDWPVSGKVISGFGARGNGLYNEGINIAVPVGTSVRAASGGVVRYAGNELRGYGNLILIEHDGGFVTAYAHNDSLEVKRGERVERGQVIAKSGQTGNVKSPQLHFEIRKGTQSVDPSKYLTS